MCFVGVNMKVSGLKGPVCWSPMARKEVGCPLDCCCYPLVILSESLSLLIPPPLTLGSCRRLYMLLFPAFA